MRLRASNGQLLKHNGQKKVELLSDSGEKMHVTFSVHDVKRARISSLRLRRVGLRHIWMSATRRKVARCPIS